MKPYSEDLRWRVVSAVASGMPREDVAWRFAVAVPTSTRWLRLKRQTGGLAPTPVPGPPSVKMIALLAALPVPILGVVSDGQQSIGRAVASASPGIPHQLCHSHYL